LDAAMNAADATMVHSWPHFPRLKRSRNKNPRVRRPGSRLQMCCRWRACRRGKSRIKTTRQCSRIMETLARVSLANRELTISEHPRGWIANGQGIAQDCKWTRMPCCSRASTRMSASLPKPPPW